MNESVERKNTMTKTKTSNDGGVGDDIWSQRPCLLLSPFLCPGFLAHKQRENAHSQIRPSTQSNPSITAVAPMDDASRYHSFVIIHSFIHCYRDDSDQSKQEKETRRPRQRRHDPPSSPSSIPFRRSDTNRMQLLIQSLYKKYATKGADDYRGRGMRSIDQG